MDLPKQKINQILIFLLWLILFGVPAYLVFKPLFSTGHLVWGDAPHFYPEQFGSLVGEPLAWVERGNNLGGPNRFLWLSPLMLLYGIFGKYFGLGNDAIIRLIFYFPAVFLAAVMPFILTRHLKYPKTVQFLCSFIYPFSTYFVLLIDGGQVGVALAYGLFPLTLFFLIRVVEKPEKKSFFWSLTFLFLLTIVDPRIAAIAVFTLVIFKPVKNLVYVVPLLIADLGLNLYWILPMIRNLVGSISPLTDSSQAVSLLYPLVFVSPHWPGNEFGKILPPPFYFIGLPILLFAGLLFKPKRRDLALAGGFLVSAFLVKGNLPPFGWWYDFLVRLPLGFAFRDTTKFFIPLTLVGGILIGQTVNNLVGKFGSKVIAVLVCCYIVALVSPVIFGKLNFNLSGQQLSGDYQTIYEKLRDGTGFFRTAWFPEKAALSFETENKPALDAKDIINLRPFAAVNTGGDVFNYVNNDKFTDWYRLLGIKYLIFTNDPRKAALSENDIKDRNNLLSLISGNSSLQKVNWETNFPVYELADTLPQYFSVDKLIAVVGSDDIYDKIKGSYSVSNSGFVFFEDGKFDPDSLSGIASDSAVLVFDNKDKTDLTISFLSKFFVPATASTSSQWSGWASDEYLKWKFELLTRGVSVSDFDYGRGLVFSTVAGEKSDFNFDVQKDGTYRVVVRSLAAKDSAGLIASFFNSTQNLVNKSRNDFEWHVMEPVNLKKGKYLLSFENGGGLQVINVVGLIPEIEWERALAKADAFTSYFQVFDITKTADLLKLSALVAADKRQDVSLEDFSTLQKNLVTHPGYWVVFTDKYDSLWQLKRGTETYNALPFYSAINGFYVDPNWNNLQIVYKGQENFRWGLYFSILSFLVITVFFLWGAAEKTREQ
jgi:hypothetical protein